WKKNEFRAVIKHLHVISILHEQLDMKKLSARWVPRLITVDHKRDRVTISKQCLEMFQRKNFVQMNFCIYSPDLALCDYFLFPNLKKWFGGKRFTTKEQLIAETEAYFEGLNKSYYSDGLKKLENRWNKCRAEEIVEK
ncbi:MOS1T transposase, partial [Pseudoatta argentina]